MDAFMAKPSEVAELFGTIERLVPAGARPSAAEGDVGL